MGGAIPEVRTGGNRTQDPKRSRRAPSSFSKDEGGDRRVDV